MRHADRSFRILLVAPKVQGRPHVKDRSLMRMTRGDTLALFDGIGLARGERAFFQRYAGGKLGWMTVASRGGPKVEAA